MIHSQINVCDHVYLITKAEVIPEDTSLVKTMVPVLKHIGQLSLTWNFEKNIPLYSLEEIWILTINQFYVRQGSGALNLIFCGEGGSKKTAWCRILSFIFGDKLQMTQLSTDKGLIPSFYGDKPQLGALLSANKIALLDDYFRWFSQKKGHTGIKQAIHQGLEQSMQIINREPYLIPNAKSQNFEVCLETPILGTDNYDYVKELREIYAISKPIFRRYR